MDIRHDFRDLAALDAQAGEDPEYDPVFLEMQQAAQEKAEQQFGDAIYPADPVDWSLVERLATQILQRTFDLRVLAYLTRSWVELRGLEGYAEGVTLVADTLERAWDHVHPAIEVDGQADPLPRMNAIAAIGEMATMGRSVRSSILLRAKGGQLTLREVEAILEGDGVAEGSYPGGRERLLKDLRLSRAQQNVELQAVELARVGIIRVLNAVQEQIGSEWCPDFSGLLRTFDRVERAWKEFVEPPTSIRNGHGEIENAEVSASSESRRPSFPMAQEAGLARGGIQSRDDAARMLEMACAYFDEREPSHPAPYLIRRALELIEMNFLEIIANLAPQGLEQFEAWIARTERTGSGDSVAVGAPN